MGSDDLYHKRRRKKEFARRIPRLPSRDRVLVVCEGHTETNYLKDLCHDLALTSVEVILSRYSDAIGIVNYAIAIYQEDRDFDRVYCVFDHDSQPSYDQAVARIRQKKKFHEATSIPCFEYWLLLHFQESSRPFRTCNDVIKVLKKSLQDYEKNMRDLHGLVKDRTDTAMRNAAEVLREMQRVDAVNPTTKVHLLVVDLQGIAAQIRY